jgi:hypothetical protein
MNPDASSPTPPDRLTQRAARAVHADLHSVLAETLLPFAGAADLGRLAPPPPPDDLPQLPGLLPTPGGAPAPYVEATVVPSDATSANVQIRFLLGRLHVRRFRALSFLLANTHETDLKVSAADGGRRDCDVWLSWQRNHAVGAADSLAHLVTLAAARVAVVHCLLRQHFPGLIGGACLAEWTAAAARSHHADRGADEEFSDAGHVWHVAAQDPAAFLAAMEEQAAEAGEPLAPDIRLHLHMWRENYPAALAAVEEVFPQDGAADRAWELGYLRAALSQRVGRPEAALALLDGLTVEDEDRNRVSGVRIRCLLALGRAREVLDLVEAGSFSPTDPTCWPHWWRAQAWRQLGDVDKAREALAAHEEFFGTDLEARRSLRGKRTFDTCSRTAPNR